MMKSDGEVLTGLWFLNAKNASRRSIDYEEKMLPVFAKTQSWLNLYFGGRMPDFTPKYRIENLTPFRKEVQDCMCNIPFGSTVSYQNIANAIAEKRGIKRMSAQAVGGAVGRNPICIIIPCHRVVGADGNLTGYGGGIQNKIALLQHEQNDMRRFYVPKTGAAL